MNVQHADFFASSSIRSSLKRGLSRQAFSQAQSKDADTAAFFKAAQDLRPNRKAMERTLGKLRRMRGVVRTAVAADGKTAVIVLRNLRSVVTRADATDIFSETSLIYTRIVALPGRGSVSFRISRVSFCLHALERLVERTSVALDRPLLPVVDAEAITALRKISGCHLLEDEGDLFSASGQSGVWAGSVDQSELEEDWGLTFPDEEARVAVFSIRTFLGPEEMRPTVWLKWKNDPAISVQTATARYQFS